MPYIQDAKVLHLFINPKMHIHDMAKNEIIKSILEPEHPELDKILANPKAAFHDVYDLNTDFYSVEMSKTPAYVFLRGIYENNKKLFNFCNSIAKLLIKFSK